MSQSEWVRPRRLGKMALWIQHHCIHHDHMWTFGLLSTWDYHLSSNHECNAIVHWLNGRRIKDKITFGRLSNLNVLKLTFVFDFTTFWYLSVVIHISASIGHRNGSVVEWICTILVVLWITIPAFYCRTYKDFLNNLITKV